MAKMCLAFSANLAKTQTDIGILNMSHFHSTRRDNLSFAIPKVYFKEKSTKIESIFWENGVPSEGTVLPSQ